MATLAIGLSHSRGNTPTPAQPLGPSNLSRQFEIGARHDEDQDINHTTPKSKSKVVSDLWKPSLSPSPAIRESPRRVSRDDDGSTVSAFHDPTTPQRPASILRGLSLQMPGKQEGEGSQNPANRVPLSPKLESTSSIYTSPSSVLPRRSRGLDFSRACTNLHHSTLAESSPDASPITGRGINIPQRRGLVNHGAVGDSPSQNPIWSSLHGEKTNLSSSVSSINMMDSDSDSSNSSDDMAMDKDIDDPMLNTPAASRLNALALTNSPGMDWLNNKSQVSAHPSLLNFQSHRMSFRRARLRNNKSTHSSSSASLRSSKPSPGPLSPPIRPSVENSGYFGMTKEQVRSRRESLSLGTDDLHLSDSEGESNQQLPHLGHQESRSTHDASSERGVIKRAVTRRSNLLPKTKGFARIRAALMEESDPLHSEAQREAQVIKQVQDTETAYTPSKPETIIGGIATTEPVAESVESTSNANDESATSDTVQEPFSTHAKRNSGGLGFWNSFDLTPANTDRYRTPPPPSLIPTDSAASDETMGSNPGHERADYQQQHTGSTSLFRQMHRSNSRSRSTTPLASNNPQNPTQADLARKVNNKRRRDDDLDPNSFKRRAVSPGMMPNSTQSSPVIPHSPTLNNDKSWGKPPAKTQNDRSNSSGSTGVSTPGPKRVGLQVMNEANDGFMSMSID